MVVIESRLQAVHGKMTPPGKPGGLGNTPNLYRPFATPGGRFDKRSGGIAIIGDKTGGN